MFSATYPKAPALHILKTDGDGFNRIGGLPSMPAGSTWPMRGARPLNFMAQFDLAEVRAAWGELGTPSAVGPLHAGELPEAGGLYFFYDDDPEEGGAWGFDPKDHDAWAVVYCPDITAVTPLARPVPLAEDAALRQSAPVRFRRLDTVMPKELFDGSLTEEDEEEFHRLREGPFDGLPKHQLLGHPDPVQGAEMGVECQLVSHGLYCGDGSGYDDPRAKTLIADASAWQLLFQLDTDDDLDLMWGDMGMVYFWIRRDDLARRDFSSVWVISQCY